MNESKFNPEEMPILSLDTSGTRLYEASRFLDSPQTISAYLAESMKSQDPQALMKALAEVAKAQGVNNVAREAGVNRESLYKSLKGGAKTRFETVRKLLLAVGVELSVQPIQPSEPILDPSIDMPSCAKKRSAAKSSAAAPQKSVAVKQVVAAKAAAAKPTSTQKTPSGGATRTRATKGGSDVENGVIAGR